MHFLIRVRWSTNLEPLLDVKNLNVSFYTSSGMIEAIKAVNFSLNRGEIVGLVGESGCGKSVTAQCILRLLDQGNEKIEGKIFFEGSNLLTKTATEMEKIRGKKIGMIFQDPFSSLNPTMRIGYQILEVLRQHENMSNAKAKDHVLSLLDLVGITPVTPRFNQYPHEFSGGMCQRIAIAMAIACSPPLIIADEPTTALDLTIQLQILELMKEIKNNHKTTIFLITHDLGVVANYCDQLLVMYGGQIIEKGPVNELFFNPQHPYTRALINAKLKLNSPEIAPPISIPESSSLPITPRSNRCCFMPRCMCAMEICRMREPVLNEVIPSHEVACWLPAKPKGKVS